MDSRLEGCDEHLNDFGELFLSAFGDFHDSDGCCLAHRQEGPASCSEEFLRWHVAVWNALSLHKSMECGPGVQAG